MQDRQLILNQEHMRANIQNRTASNLHPTRTEYNMALLKAIKNQIPSFKENRELILIKLLLFTYYGGMACVFPYLAVHMKQIGISVQETAVIHAMLPIAMFMGPPIAGFIADKFGGHRLMLTISLILTGLLHTSLLWVPQAQSGANLNSLTTMSCDGNGTLDISRSSSSATIQLSFRVPQASCSATKPVTVMFSDCIQRCHGRDTYSLVKSNDEADLAPAIATITTNLCHHGEFCVGYDQRSGDYELSRTSFQVRSINSSLLTDHRERDGEMKSTHFLTFHPPETAVQKSCSNLFGRVGPHDAGTTVAVAEEIKAPCVLSCTELSDDDVNLIWAPNCGSSSKTFWIYLALRVLASIFMACCFCLFDATTMFIVSRHKTDYGRQRIWPILAMATFPPITGFLVDYYSAVDGVPGVINYTTPFVMLDVLLICTLLLLSFGGLVIRASSTEDTNLRAVGRLLKNPRVDLLIVSLFILGTLWGYVEVFLYWFLMELASPTYLLGLTLTVGSGIGIPVLFFADKIINRLGNVTILFAAFIFYSIRYIGYSFIYNPWWCLIFEAMEIFTVHLMWVSVVTHTADIVPKGLQATMQGVMGGTHYGFGRGSGSLIGGLLMGYIGARSTFRYMGIGAAIAGLIYLFFAKVVFRALPDDVTSNDETEKGTETKEEHTMKNSGTRNMNDHEQKNDKQLEVTCNQ